MISGINGYNNSLATYQSTSRSGEDESTQGSTSTSPSGWDGVNTAGSVSSGGGLLTMTDFYTLLAAQLRYQDADNPMDTSEMMGQMVQTQMMQTISQLSEVTITTYAASMAGREVTVAEVDGTGTYTGESTVGVVEGVYLAGSSPVLMINGKAYDLSQLMVVGRMPETEGSGETSESTDEVKDPDAVQDGEEVKDPDTVQDGEKVEDPDAVQDGEETEDPDAVQGGGEVDDTDTVQDGNGTQGAEGSIGTGGAEETENSGADGQEEDAMTPAEETSENDAALR